MKSELAKIIVNIEWVCVCVCVCVCERQEQSKLYLSSGKEIAALQ